MERERIELQKSLVNDISKGMRQVKQVKVSSSEEERVVERMLSSYEEALLILTGRAPEGQCQSVITSSSKPPPSLPPAHKSGSIRALKRRRAITKRLMVKIKASGEKYGGAADDGYSWRKYGQKPILNSIYPRNYFKCQAKSCGARKQEQRSENDPTTVEVTYTGVHTCQPKSEVISTIDLNAMAEVNFDGECLDFIGILD